MKKLSINIISLLLGLAIASLSLVLLILNLSDQPHVTTILLVAIPVVVMAVIFFISRWVLNSFVTRQIYPLYRILHSNLASKQSRKRLISRNLIGEVEGEVREWEETRKREVEKLKGLDNYRKEFLGNVYHELKTPIFNMQGYILTLLEGGLEDQSINRVYLERTEKNINRMISIVEDLESIYGLEQGALNLNKEAFDIRKLIDELIEANEMRASRQKIKLEATKIRESDSIVIADRKRIYQVLNNLVVNSINYGTKGGKTTLSVSPAGENVLVEVRDNGIGINNSDIPRVFERFYRVDKSRSRDSGGTGLGLAIVKHIIEAHNQTVRVKSTSGAGTTFVFTLTKG